MYVLVSGIGLDGEGDYKFLPVLTMEDKVPYICLKIKRSSVSNNLYLIASARVTGILSIKKNFV